MKEQLLALLNDNFPEIDFTESNALVDDGHSGIHRTGGDYLYHLPGDGHPHPL